MHQITSVNNKQVKQWRKLKTSKERKKQGTYLVEGYHLVEEALNFDEANIRFVMVREDLIEREEILLLNIPEDKLILINLNISEELSQTETNPGVYAEVNMVKNEFPSEITGPLLLLDRIQDPGNVGTMIRTADAAGFQGVLLGKGTVDLYNIKTLRGAQGSHFHLDIYEGEILSFIKQCQENNYPVLGTALNEKAKSYKEIKMDQPFALIMGNEGEGISDEVIEHLDENVFIPMKGQAESLNVAIAASILMFHFN